MQSQDRRGGIRSLDTAYNLEGREGGAGQTWEIVNKLKFYKKKIKVF